MLPEVMDPEDLAGSGNGPGGPGGDANRNLAALFSGLDNDNLHQLKLDLAKADPENADRIKHLIAKKVCIIRYDSYHITHHLSLEMIENGARKTAHFRCINLIFRRKSDKINRNKSEMEPGNKR